MTTIKEYLNFWHNSFKGNDTDFCDRKVIFKYWRTIKRDLVHKYPGEDLDPSRNTKTLIITAIVVNRLCLNKIGNFRSDL